MKRNIEDTKFVKKINITEEQYASMKNMVDFYTFIGLFTGSEKIDVQKVHMNDDDCRKLEDLMFKNSYRKGKFRHYTKKALKTSCAWEWLGYSPCSIFDIPHNEIWLEEGWLMNEQETQEK